MGSHAWTQRHIDGAISYGARTLHVNSLEIQARTGVRFRRRADAMTGEHHVLIVEDDSRTAELHTSMLRREGYEVYAARDGVSRIDLARAWLPDAVIADVTSPSRSSATTIAPTEGGQS